MVSFCHEGIAPLDRLSHAEKDGLIQGLRQGVQTLRAAVDALQRRRHTPATATTEQYCTRFRGSLWEILNLYPKLVAGQRLLKRYQKIRAHLLLFLSDETIPLTNHTSEQALCWSADGLATGLSNYDIDEE